MSAPASACDPDRTAVEPDASLDDLTLAAATGDRVALAALYRRLVGPVYGYCLRQLGTVEHAEDATTETFLRALTALPTYRAGAARSWFFTIARNVVHDQLRRQPVTPLSSITALTSREASPEAQALARLDQEWLQHNLRALTPDQRDVLALRLAGLRTEEIAATMQKTRNAVDALQFRALARLRDRHTAEGAD